jgi:hypothetical protein
MSFDRECTETFWEGHVRAFEHFQGVALRITYDNTKVCIAKITGKRQRELTKGFLQLVSHYLFDPHFCLVRRANEKGVAEGLVKFARLNFFVPVPQVRDFAELNAYLLKRCKEDLQRRLRGKTLTKAQLLLEDQAAFRKLPAAAFDACRIQTGQADSESLVRFDNNDYSVPVEYAHHPVVIKGYVDTAEICYGPKVIARHPRCWEKEKQILDPMRCIIFSWPNASRGAWIMPDRWSPGSCRRSLACCDAGWNRSIEKGIRARGRGNMSAFCDCWRNTPSAS